MRKKNFIFRKTIDWKQYVKIVAIVSVIIAGTLMRLFGFYQREIWFDEAVSIRIAHSSSLIEFLTNSLQFDTMPPLYPLILSVWIRLFNDNLMTVRLFSSLLSLLTIFMIFLLGKRLFNGKVGILSALILSISPLHIYYAQEARSYSLFTFLSLVSFYFFSKLMERRNFLHIFFYIVSNVLLLYTHPYAPFFLASQFIFFLVMVWREKSYISFLEWIFIHIIIFVFFIPWIPYLLQISMRVQKNFWIRQPTFFSIIEVFHYAAPYIFPIFLVLSFMPFFRAWTEKKFFLQIKNIDSTALYLLAFWITIPIIIPAIFSIFFMHIFYYRYLIPVSLAFYILVAKGLSRIHFLLSTLILVVYVCFSFLFLYDLSLSSHSTDWEQILRFLHNNKKDGDIILFSHSIKTDYNYGFEELPFAYTEKYLRKNQGLRKQSFQRGFKDLDTFNEYLTHINKHRRILLIHSRYLGIDSPILHAVKKSYKISRELHYAHTHIYIFYK